MSSFRAWGCEGLEKVELSERRFMERGAQCSLQSEGGTEGTKSWSAGYRATSPHLSGKRARFPAPSPSLPLTQRWKGRRRGSCCFHERAIKAICSLSDAHLPKCRGKRELRREWKFDSKFKIPQKVRGVRGRAGLYHAMKSSVIGQFRFHVAMERERRGENLFSRKSKTALALPPPSHYLPPSLSRPFREEETRQKSRYKKVFALSDHEENSSGLLILARPSPPSPFSVFAGGFWGLELNTKQVRQRRRRPSRHPFFAIFSG